MTGPTDEDAVRELRAALSDRTGSLTPPPGLYGDIRRRHRRQRSALVAGTAAVAVAAVALPTTVLRDRPGNPAPITAAAGRGFPVPGPQRFCVPDRDPSEPAPPTGLQPQRDVRGSLGNDPAAVTAVLRTVWGQLGRPGQNDSVQLDPRTARVWSVERTADGKIVGTVSLTDAGRHFITQGIATGPDLEHLHTEGGQGGSGLGLPDPIDIPFLDGDWYAQIVTVGCDGYLSVVAPPGSTGRLSWITAVAADGTPQRDSLDLGLGPDGVAAVKVPAAIALSLRIESAGRVLVDAKLRQTGGFPTSSDSVSAAVAAAPGKGSVGLAAGVLGMGSVHGNWPASELQVLWRGEAPAGYTVTAATLTLPSGAQVVWGGISNQPGYGPGGSPNGFYGVLPAGALDRSALTWRMRLPGKPLAIFVAGTREVRIERGAQVRTVTVTGGLVVPDGDTVTAVTVGGRPALDATRLARPAGLLGDEGR